MNKSLYAVTCFSHNNFSLDSIEIYVIADTSTKAEEMALQEMTKRDWKYRDGVSQTRRLASVDSTMTSMILVL